MFKIVFYDVWIIFILYTGTKSEQHHHVSTGYTTERWSKRQERRFEKSIWEGMEGLWIQIVSIWIGVSACIAEDRWAWSDHDSVNVALFALFSVW